MDADKQTRLEAAGFKVGSAEELLGLKEQVKSDVLASLKKSLAGMTQEPRMLEARFDAFKADAYTVSKTVRRGGEVVEYSISAPTLWGAKELVALAEGENG
jgi:hypothetical protein